MRGLRFVLSVAVALAAAGCARQQQAYVIDPQTGQPVPIVTQQAYAPQPAQPIYAQSYQPQVQPASGSRGLFSSQTYARQTYETAPSGRGLFNSRLSAPPVYTAPPVQQPYVLQYGRPAAPAPQYAPPYAAPQAAYALTPPNAHYTLDAGDRLRIVVFGQDGISNSYVVDAGGNVNLPLIGTVPARGTSTQALAQAITARLKQGFVREPHVTVEVETYRPFFILGEVTNPGQYPYVADMTVEKAIAIAGGFAPRAHKGNVEVTRNALGQQFKGQVPLTHPLRPGDTVVVKERWF
jgi:protein involved in polysaccharide export with SLBB domain